VQLTLNRCGARNASSELKTQTFLELQLVQTRLEEDPELPWFLLSESSSTTTTSGEPRVVVPSDFLMEEETIDLWAQNADGDWKELIKIEYDRLKNEYQNDSNAFPKYYALRGGYFYLGPTPDASYSLRMTYYKKDTVPATGVTNQWSTYAPDLLIAELGAVIAGDYLSDFEKQQSFEKGIIRARTRLYHKDVARDEANQIGELRG
jgi:hypothetical protein